MEEFLKKFDLDLILRYLLPGISFLWGLHQGFDMTKQNMPFYVVFVSVAIYCIHRNLVHPFIERCFAMKNGYKDHTDFKIRLWEKIKKDSILEKMREWSSQIHFLFCLSWSLFASFVYIWIFGLTVEASKKWFNIILAVVFLVAALVGLGFQFKIIKKRLKPE